MESKIYVTGISWEFLSGYLEWIDGLELQPFEQAPVHAITL